jgi:hypothetical protein
MYAIDQLLPGIVSSTLRILTIDSLAFLLEQHLLRLRA